MRAIRGVPCFILFAGLVGCESKPPEWSGPLAGVTDSVTAGVTLTCRPSEFSGKFGEFRFAQPPFRECEGSKADTGLSIASGAGHRVVWVSRSWQPSTEQSLAHHDLVQTLESKLGPGKMCPQSDDQAVQENVRWAGEGYNLGVAKIDSSHVAWGYSLGPIDCHRG
jgi:hypothetical protein